MSCVSFLRPFLETMVSGGLATNVHLTNTSYTKSKSSKLSSLRSSHKASKAKPAYQMENLSEVGLNDRPGPLGKAESNANSLHNDVPSIHNDEIHFSSPPTNTNDYHDDLGPLRPDMVTSFSRVSNPPLEEDQVLSLENGEMVITTTKEWEVQKEYKHAIKKKERNHRP